jgi:hypothetical protein
MALAVTEAIYGPTVGIYREVGRNDEAITSAAYAVGLHTSLEQIYRSTFWVTMARFACARQQLSATASLAQGWDTYGAEPPNNVARDLATRVLAALEKSALPPTQLTPTVEGGIALSFVDGHNRAVIELYNTGEVAAATYSDEGTPAVWDIEPDDAVLQHSIEQIRVHLSA